MSSKGNPTPPGKGASQPKTSPGAIGSPFAFSAKAKAASKPRHSKLESTQNKFMALLDALDEEEFDQFREFVREELQFEPEEPELTEEMLAAMGLQDGGAPDEDSKLTEIIHFLRSALPLSALAHDEKMTIPKGEHYEGYTEQNTIHVDEFLYTDEEAQELTDAHLLPQDYCATCGSHDIKHLNYISHSLPRAVTRWLYAAALPSVKGKVVVDVGSRLGPVLWNGYLFSHAKELIGIELNKTFSALAQQIVDTHKFGDRIKIINDNVLNQAETLKSGDVVVLNNVFEWFTSQDDLRNMWNFVVSSITKKGTIVVTSPSIEESFAHAGITDIDTSKWVKKLEVNYPSPSPHSHHGHGEEEDCDEDFGDVDPFFESVREIHLYEVL